MNFIKKIIKVVLTRGIGALSGILVTLCITYFLNQSAAGVVLFSITIVAMLGQLLPFGSEIYSMRLVGAQSDRSWKLINEEISAIFILFLIFNFIFFVGLIVFDLVFAISIFPIFDNNLILCFVYLAGSSLAFTQIVSRAFIGLGKSVWASFLQSVLGPVFFLVVFYVLASSFEFEVIDVIKIYSFCFFCTGVFSAVTWFRLNNSSFCFKLVLSTEMKTALLTLGSISTVTVIVQYSTQLLSVFFLSPEEIASFSVSRRISLLVSFILIAVNLIQAPRFAKAFANEELKEIDRLALISGKVLILVAVTVFVFVCFFSEYILGLFGEEYKKDRILLLILMLGQCVNVVTGSVMFILNMTNNERSVLNVTLFMAPVAVLLTVFFSSNYGLLGVAIVTSFLISVQNLTYVYIVKKRLGFNTLNIFRKV